MPAPKLERSGPPQKTEVICVDDLGGFLEWRLEDLQNVAKVSTGTAGSITLGVAVGPRHFIADQLSAKADVIPTQDGDQLCQDPQTEFAFRESMGVSRINHILRIHGHTIFQEQRAADTHVEFGQRSLERLFPGLTEDSVTQATLESRSAAVIETAISTYLSALDEDQATAKLFVQKAAQAAEEAWQQTFGGPRTERPKPDSRSPRTPQFRFSR